MYQVKMEGATRYANVEWGELLALKHRMRIIATGLFPGQQLDGYLGNAFADLRGPANDDAF